MLMEEVPNSDPAPTPLGTGEYTTSAAASPDLEVSQENARASNKQWCTEIAR